MVKVVKDADTECMSWLQVQQETCMFLTSTLCHMAANPNVVLDSVKETVEVSHGALDEIATMGRREGTSALTWQCVSLLTLNRSQNDLELDHSTRCVAEP